MCLCVIILTILYCSDHPFDEVSKCTEWYQNLYLDQTNKLEAICLESWTTTAYLYKRCRRIDLVQDKLKMDCLAMNLNNEL
jgi:hypothetical protein